MDNDECVIFGFMASTIGFLITLVPAVMFKARYSLVENIPSWINPLIDLAIFVGILTMIVGAIAVIFGIASGIVNRIRG